MERTPSMDTPPPLPTFCAYASEDQALFQKLEQALRVYNRQGVITLWHHGKLLPGAEWDNKIRHQLHTAQLILLLISPAFLHSDYIWQQEIPWAMARHTSGDACVIPILLKPPPGWELTPLYQLQALPTGNKTCH